MNKVGVVQKPEHSTGGLPNVDKNDLSKYFEKIRWEKHENRNLQSVI